VIRWENDLSPYEERSVAITITKQFNRLSEESTDIGNLFKVLSFLNVANIPSEMIVNGAKEWLRSQNGLQHAPSPLPSPPPSKPTILQKIKSLKLRRRKTADTKSRPDSVTQAPRISSEFRSLVSLILSPTHFRTAIQKLQNLSLVEHRSDSGNSSLWMHDLIQFTMQEGARKEETYRELLQYSVSLVCAALRRIKDPDLPQSWAECEEFVLHLRSLNQRWNSLYGANLELVRANSAVALYLWSRGRYDEAEVLQKEVLKSYEPELGSEHKDTLASMNLLGLIYDSQGQYDDASALHKRVLALREKHLGADHPSTLDSMNNLALVYQSQGQYDDASALHKRALALQEKRLGADHPSTLDSMNSLGLIYKSQGRYDDAKALHKRVLALQETHLGADHPSTLHSMNNLALVYQSQGQYDDAEALYKRALTGREKHLGANHPKTRKTAENLANLYRLQGRCSETESTTIK
jgi:tetratricopeptide (TPR) repeat protein